MCISHAFISHIFQVDRALLQQKVGDRPTQCAQVCSLSVELCHFLRLSLPLVDSCLAWIAIDSKQVGWFLAVVWSLRCKSRVIRQQFRLVVLAFFGILLAVTNGFVLDVLSYPMVMWPLQLSVQHVFSVRPIFMFSVDSTRARPADVFWIGLHCSWMQCVLLTDDTCIVSYTWGDFRVNLHHFGWTRCASTEQCR